MTYPADTDPVGSIPPQSDAVETPPGSGTWVGGTVDSAAAVIEPLRLGVLDIMAYLGLTGDAANPTGTVTAVLQALRLLAASAAASVASASTVTLPTTGAFVTVTGTTAVNDIALPAAPLTTRLVILKAASDGLVFHNGNHLKLGADVTLNADQTLALFCDGSNWYPVGAVNLGAALANPMTTQDDVIIGGTAGAPARLAKGADGQVLTVDPTTHHVGWAASASGFANPMTTAGDVILGGTAGTGTRLAKGSDSQVLTIDPTTHLPLWATPTALTNPMTTPSDVIIGGAAGAPSRLAKGGDGQVLTVDPTTHAIVWANSASGFANPMVAQDDLIMGGTAGTGVRLAKGTDGQVLTVDPSTHHLVWRTIPTFGVGQDGLVPGPGALIAGQFLASNGAWATPSGSGMSNPMTTTGDLIKGGSSGTPGRLAIGSTGDVLTVVSGAPAWAAPSGGGGSTLRFPTRRGTVVNPTISMFPTAVNVGSETATDNADGGIDFWDPPDTGNNWTHWLQAVPGSTPWTAEALIAMDAPAQGGSYARFHVIVKNAAGAFTAFGLEAQSTGIQAGTLHVWSSVTTPVTTPVNNNYPERLAWLRVQDDGTNLNFWMCAFGLQFGPPVQTLARSINSSGVPTLVGVGVNNTNSAGVAGALLSWSVF